VAFPAELLLELAKGRGAAVVGAEGDAHGAQP
jgi:hypothetical protein